MVTNLSSCLRLNHQASLGRQCKSLRLKMLMDRQERLELRYHNRLWTMT